MTPSLVRPYRATDRSDLHRLAADTAFFGEPVERFLEDRRLFCDITFAYYTDQEPEHAFVAAEEDRFLGFIVGCVETSRQQRYLAGHALPRAVAKLLTGYYRTGPRTWQWLRQFAGSALRRDIAAVDLHDYPAHLHMSVDSRSRGKGVGRKLIERYLDHLRELEVRGVHLRTTDHNQAACRLYQSIGMQLLDARPTGLWSHVVAEPVESRSYGLRL